MDANYANKLEVSATSAGPIRWRASPDLCRRWLALRAAQTGPGCLAMFSCIQPDVAWVQYGRVRPSSRVVGPNILFPCSGIYQLWLTAHERTPHVATFFRNPVMAKS